MGRKRCKANHFRKRRLLEGSLREHAASTGRHLRIESPKSSELCEGNSVSWVQDSFLEGIRTRIVGTVLRSISRIPPLFLKSTLVRECQGKDAKRRVPVKGFSRRSTFKNMNRIRQSLCPYIPCQRRMSTESPPSGKLYSCPRDSNASNESTLLTLPESKIAIVRRNI